MLHGIEEGGSGLDRLTVRSAAIELVRRSWTAGTEGRRRGIKVQQNRFGNADVVAARVPSAFIGAMIKDSGQRQ